MSSVLRPVRKRKKGRTLGRVDIMRREDYAELELDAKVELIRSLVPLGLMQVEELLDAEVTALAGEHYARKAASIGGRRHGSNPGTVSLAGQRVPIRVPRVRSVAGSELPLRSYEALRGEGAVNALLLKRVLYGISCRNYEAAAEAIPGAIGLSGSTVSRSFIAPTPGARSRRTRRNSQPGRSTRTRTRRLCAASDAPSDTRQTSTQRHATGSLASCPMCRPRERTSTVQRHPSVTSLSATSYQSSADARPATVDPRRDQRPPRRGRSWSSRSV